MTRRLLATLLLIAPLAQAADPRLRELAYDPQAVVPVPLKRGMVGLIVLPADEAIAEVAAGLGGDCARADSPWCITAQPGGRHLFIKAKASAQAPNNLVVVSNRRTHSFVLQVLADKDSRAPTHRLVIHAPAPPPALLALPVQPPPPVPAPEPAPPPPQALVAERLKARPQVLNTQYTLAEGPHSQDIVPTLVFDDGRFTYLRLPGHREVPAVFYVQGDGCEALANTRMEDDLLVVDRVSRHLVLRAGAAVVGLWNEAFDIEGLPPQGGTTAPGVVRRLKAPAVASGETR